MDLSFERGDLLQLDPISNTETLRLLPPGKKRKQKLIVGDDLGNLGCYEFKKGEPVPVFTSRLFEGPITSVAIGGVIPKRDKIFAAHGQRVVGITKKGKEFFKLTSSLTETIRHLVVEDTKIWTGCEYIYNMYENGHDVAFYMCHDQINALTTEYISRDHDYDAILGCQDSTIRVVAGSDLVSEVSAAAPVTALCSMSLDDTKVRNSSHGTSIVYGMENGAVATAVLRSAHAAVGGSPRRDAFHIRDDNANKSAVNVIRTYDITQDGVGELIVGRNDGRMEVFVCENGGSQAGPQRAFTRDLGESIRAVECGKVNSTDFNEVVVASYSGKVVSFTSEPVQQRAQDDTYGRSVATVNNENRIKHLKKEIETLRAKLEKDKAKAASNTSKSGTVERTNISALDFAVNSSFSLDADAAAYVLSIEIQSPLDLVILQSDVRLDLVENDLGSSVLSVSPQMSASDDKASKFVATYRCQNLERKLNLMIRTTEGECGELSVTIVTSSTPKAAKVIRIPLKPLSLHTRVHDLSSEEKYRHRNKIKFTGPVSLSILHEWVSSVMPEVPARIDENSTGEKYSFKNTVTQAVAVCTIKKYELVFESENPSTIAIFKENVLRQATSRRMQLEEQTSLLPETIPSFLSLIRSPLEYQLSLSRKMQLVDAIQEITMDDKDTRWLSPEYTDILKNQDLIRKQFSNRTKELERLSGIVTDLFVDWHKLKGRDVREAIPQVYNLLMANQLDGVISLVNNY